MSATAPTSASGMWFSVACRHCAGPLAEQNAGHADGCRSLWVGACRDCGRHYMVTADICPLPSRGPNERHA